LKNTIGEGTKMYWKYQLFFAENKLVESTDHEAGMFDATSTEL
jgi:hypothetical protein